MRKAIRVMVTSAAVAALSACALPDSDERPISTTTGNAAYAEPSATRSAPSYTPTTSDYDLQVIELEKKCFGSAGCSVTYLVDPTYLGRPLGEDQSFRIIYAINGGDDPETGSFVVRGSQYQKPGEERISTPSSASVLTATVTRIIPE